MHRFSRTCLAVLPAALTSLSLQAQQPQQYSVGTVTAAAGQKVSGFLDVPAGVDEGARIPITIVHGSRPGPVLALVAGTHGYEYPPITALQRVRNDLDATELSGTVIMVHVANMPSFLGRSIYYSPVDGKNLNRVYPGDPNGTLSERTAHVITTEVISRADYFADMHCGDGNEALRPYLYMAVTGDPHLDSAVKGMALAFGIDHIVIDHTQLRSGPSLYTDKTALDRGIPAITTETGGLGSNDPVWVDMAARGVWNLLRHLAMVPGEVESAGAPVWLEDSQVVTSPATGIFEAAVRGGHAVAEGQLLGTLVDFFGDEVQEIRAPFAGVVNYVVGTPPVSQGEPVAMVSRILSPHRGGPEFDVVEATIADIHEAMRSGALTARTLVQLYLDRIEAYDKQGPAINAIITINPNAFARAAELDSIFAESGLLGPLHGIPVIVKDNYDTHDLPTTAGSLSLAGSVPPDDAFQVRRIREAGAIVLAKSNMAEFAFSPYETVGSMLPGYTRNPYALNRVTAGSSGGTAAAVAANLGAVGLGTDTGNSIRGPSSHNALVGIRSTMGLTSRDGIIPLYYDHDIGGPMARTVADAVAVFDVIVGYDPADPVTAESRSRSAARYADFLDADALRGARIGVARQWSNREGFDPEVLALFEAALDDLRHAGATVVDSVIVPEMDELRRSGLWCSRFKHDINTYLASLGPTAPLKNLEEIIASRRFHPTVGARLESSQAVEDSPEDNAGCIRSLTNRELLRAAVQRQFAAHDIDALVYPTWSNAPRLIGDLNTPHGDNSQDLSPHTGFPAITVPMGYAKATLPVGLQFFGDAWSEPRLIALAYSYEQATRHRVPPTSVPALRR